MKLGIVMFAGIIETDRVTGSTAATVPRMRGRRMVM